MAIRYTKPTLAWDLSRTENLVKTVNRILGFVAVAILLLLGIGLLSQPVTADPADVPRGELVTLLGKRYAEVPVAIGLTDAGGVIEVLSTGDGSTWTIILTVPNGMSRVLGSGESWTLVTPAAGQGI